MGGLGSGRPPSGCARGNVLGWRPLTLDDLASPRAARVDALRQIRARHHRIALLLAKGWSSAAIAAETHTTPTSIRQLEKDPAICELVAEFQVTQEVLDQPLLDERKHYLDLISTRACGHLADRLDDPEAVALMSNKDLVASASLALDRTGYPKQTTLVHHDGDIAIRLEAAIERSSKVIDLRPRPTVGLEAGEGLLASAPPQTYRRSYGGQRP